MVVSVQLSDNLIGWARDAGYFYSIESPDGRSIFATEGGEDRIYLGPATEQTGWFNATEASRSGGESFFYAASSVYYLERYLWRFFGAIYRATQRLPRLPIPINREYVADPYRIESYEDGYVLTDGGSPIMRVETDITDIAILVRTSYWLKVSEEELKYSYRDPDGSPLFPLQG